MFPLLESIHLSIKMYKQKLDKTRSFYITSVCNCQAAEAQNKTIHQCIHVPRWLIVNAMFCSISIDYEQQNTSIKQRKTVTDFIMYLYLSQNQDQIYTYSNHLIFRHEKATHIVSSK